MNKEKAVSAWLFSGIFDLYVGFYLDPFQFNKPEVFYSIMGLEKILKSYILCEKANQYENLQETKAMKKIEKITIYYSHDYKKMIDFILPKINQPIESILKTDYLHTYDDEGNIIGSYKGENFLQVLKRIYIDSRYPTAEPISSKFKANEHFNWDILHSSDLIEFIHKLCLEVIKNLKGKVNLVPKMEKVENYLGHNDDWKRFKNIFFKETNGSIEVFFN